MNLLLEQEQNTLCEIIKIIMCLSVFVEGKNKKKFNASMFKHQMKIYDEKIILLKIIVDELKKNGENVNVYENITENLGNFSTEFQKIYDSHM